MTCNKVKDIPVLETASAALMLGYGLFWLGVAAAVWMVETTGKLK